MSATAIGRTVSLLAALFTASASASAQDTAVTARPDSIMLADSLAPDSARARDRGPDSLTVLPVRNQDIVKCLVDRDAARMAARISAFRHYPFR